MLPIFQIDYGERKNHVQPAVRIPYVVTPPGAAGTAPHIRLRLTTRMLTATRFPALSGLPAPSSSPRTLGSHPPAHAPTSLGQLRYHTVSGSADRIKCASERRCGSGKDLSAGFSSSSSLLLIQTTVSANRWRSCSEESGARLRGDKASLNRRQAYTIVLAASTMANNVEWRGARISSDEVACESYGLLISSP